MAVLEKWFAQPDAAQGTALVLPGRRFGVGTPLLHWTSMLLAQRGWSVIAASWDEEALQRSAVGHVVATAAAALEGAGASGLPVLVVGKSLGTLALPWAVAEGLSGVWLTPLLGEVSVLSAVKKAQRPTMLVGGTADPSWIRPAAIGTGVRVLELADADHGLQLSANWRVSLLGQLPVFDAIAEFADEVLEHR